MAVSATPPNHSGTQLRTERERAEMSIRDLAYFARVSHPTIQRIENGTLIPRPALKARLARILRVRLEELWPLDGPLEGDTPAGGMTEAARTSDDAQELQEAVTTS